MNALIKSSPVGDWPAKTARSGSKSPRKELSLESRNPDILNKEERADNFYKNQSATVISKRNESTVDESYEYELGS
ncbi:hypothetical protein [Acinetobacter sp. TSRC1-2]|uniref:hypothetical protein n=1 Tax=unclassified Acinetobacter TaxID=196816 RepID=UPI003CF5A0B2